MVLGLVLGLMVCPWLYFFALNPKYAKTCYKLIRFWCLGMFYGMGFRYDLIKKTSKNIDPNRPYIMIANHTSMVDVFLMSVLHPHHPICFVGKKELEKIPIFGTIFKRVAVSVDRKDKQSRAEVYVKCAERMRNGYSIVIFPEGGVPDDTSIVLDEFKNGAFSLSSQHHFPIVVYTFLGLKEMFPFDNSKGYPGRVKVYLNDILEPNSDAEYLKEKSWNLIKNTLDKEK